VAGVRCRRALATLVVFFAAPAAHAAVVAYPSAQSIRPSGSLPPQGASSSISLAVALGETEDAQIVVTGAKQISASLDAQPLRPMIVRLLWAHYVHFGSRLVPDALQPWDGGAQAAEEANQPLWVQVGVRNDTPPGVYRSALRVVADGRTTVVPLTVQVFHVTLPDFRARSGALQTSFGSGPQAYVSKVSELYGVTGAQALVGVDSSLFRFLADHRMSPAQYGYGDPGPKSDGYQRSTRWWLDSATNLERELTAAGGAFPDFRVPISNNRTPAVSYQGGMSPYHPESWCSYLGSIHDFWRDHGWLSGTTPYLYSYDEPGSAQSSLLGRQALAAHRCFAGSKVLVTTSPTRNNRALWDGRGGDDVDIWTPLARRYYGTFANSRGPQREHDLLADIEGARARGHTIWTYTYKGVSGTPGFTATEPLADSRMLFLWAALEGIPGVLYGEGTTSYDRGNPFQSVSRDGEFVLIYPGVAEPVPSARIEQIRDGIEDWSLYQLVRARRGSATVRAILGGEGLFSATAQRVLLACSSRCDLLGSTQYAWPRWSHDATTAVRIERAKLRALQLLAG
jgi:hypothetical protein